MQNDLIAIRRANLLLQTYTVKSCGNGSEEWRTKTMWWKLYPHKPIQNISRVWGSDEPFWGRAGCYFIPKRLHCLLANGAKRFSSSSLFTISPNLRSLILFTFLCYFLSAGLAMRSFFGTRYLLCEAKEDHEHDTTLKSNQKKPYRRLSHWLVQIFWDIIVSNRACPLCSCPPEFFRSTKLFNQPKLPHTWLGQYWLIGPAIYWIQLMYIAHCNALKNPPILISLKTQLCWPDVILRICQKS